MRELVAGADHERVEGVARIQLRRAIPVEAGLRRSGAGAGGAESPPLWRTAVAAGSSSGRHEFHVAEFETEIVDGFLNEVGILIAGVAELHRRHANEKIPPLEWL
jgi:hypothetical protein